MTGYRVSYLNQAGEEHLLNDAVYATIRRDGMVGFEAPEIDLPTYRRPLRDGGRAIGRPYTAPRAFGLITDVLHDSHELLAAYIADKVHRVNPYQDEDTTAAVRVYTPDGRTRQIDVRASRVEPVYNGPVVAALGYYFYAPYPFFYDPVVQSDTFALSTPGGITFPLTFPITFAPTTIDITHAVSNDGEVATWPVITIYGPGDDPLIENLTSGTKMQLTNDGGIDLDVNDYIAIDMDAATILFHDNSAGTDTYIPQKRTTDSVFWQLLPGDNNIHVTLSNVTVGSVKMEWYEFYRSGL